MCWNPARLQLRGLNCPPRLCRCPRAMETVNNNVSRAAVCGGESVAVRLHVWKRRSTCVPESFLLLYLFVCIVPCYLNNLAGIASRLICAVFSLEVDEVCYNTGHLSVQNSMQCFSGCALHKLFALFFVMRCREQGLVSKVYGVMHRKEKTRQEHVVNQVVLLTHGWEWSLEHFETPEVFLFKLVYM